MTILTVSLYLRVEWLCRANTHSEFSYDRGGAVAVPIHTVSFRLKEDDSGSANTHSEFLSERGVALPCKYSQ